MNMRRTEQETRFDRLRSLDLFEDVTDSEAIHLDNLSTESRIPAGRRITREGTGGLEFLVILEGTARVTRGEDFLADLGPGSFFGELALLDGISRGATATALEPMRVMVFNAGEFSGLIQNVPSVRDKILATAEQRRASA
jgi:CRP/FNR family transcriptional regulator, cyclic AMP receptor protein